MFTNENESELVDFLGKYDTYIFSLNGEQKYLGFGLDENKKIRSSRYESWYLDKLISQLMPLEYGFNYDIIRGINPPKFRGYTLNIVNNVATLSFIKNTITIDCYNDSSCVVNDAPYEYKTTNIGDLFTLNTVDYDQSSFTDNKMYVVLDVFKVGKFNSEQLISYNEFINELLDGKNPYKTSFAMMVCYDFETGEAYDGLWDYIHKCPLVMHRVFDDKFEIFGKELAEIKNICNSLVSYCHISQNIVDKM